MIPSPAPHPSKATSTATPAHDSFDALLTSVGRQQDRAAFIRLFHHFAPRIKSFLMKGGATPEQAEELAQETMISVWTRAAGFDPERASASTWIFTIARNKRIDALRKSGRMQYDPADPAFVPDTAAAADISIFDSERTARIAAVLKTLPPEQSALIHKAYFENKTHSEIAREEKIPLGTVKSRLRLALDRLRPQLDKGDMQ